MKLIRFAQTPDGVFGRMQVGSDFLYTLEDDWLDNRRNESCIPAGRYILRRTIYHKHNIETFEVTGVPNRSRILIHVGNTEEDTAGCILVGMRLGQLWVPNPEDGEVAGRLKRDVAESREAFGIFMTHMRGIDECPFLVEWAPNIQTTLEGR